MDTFKVLHKLLVTMDVVEQRNKQIHRSKGNRIQIGFQEEIRRTNQNHRPLKDRVGY